MPTFQREGFIHAAVDCWRRQKYEPKELIILDDGDGEEIVGAGIRYERLVKKESVGVKRNLCCELARGTIICHFDTDDWSHPDRITDQVENLRENKLPITGYGTLLFWDIVTQEAKRYKPTIKNYVCGTTLCYLRDLWIKHPFKDKDQGEDNQFIYPILTQVFQSHETGFMVARIHASNHTSSKSAIKDVVPRETLPMEFWKNEKVRLDYVSSRDRDADVSK